MEGSVSPIEIIASANRRRRHSVGEWTTMKLNRRLLIAVSLSAALVSIATSPARAVVAAKEDFDGGSMNLVSGFNPTTENLDGGPGDWFGVGSRGSWPQGHGAGPDPPGMPFGLADDSVVSVSDPFDPPFPTDSEGIFGQARSLTDDFFGISDTREWTEPPLTPLMASWTFNVAGFTNLWLSIDIGAMSNEAFPLAPATLIEFKYQVDGGPTGTAFSLKPDSDSGGYGYRLMDSFLPQFAHADGPLVAIGDNPVTKKLVDTGEAADNTVLDKSPPEGTGAGLMDTFTTALEGSGNQLTLTMTAHLPFEAMAFDNIVIEGDGSAAGVLGDYNDNRAVDAADYVLWRNGGPLANESDNPGIVNQADYEFWRARFGAVTGSGASAAVPEPASAILLCCGAGLLLAVSHAREAGKR
jgi:hypothetical protein